MSKVRKRKLKFGMKIIFVFILILIGYFLFHNQYFENTENSEKASIKKNNVSLIMAGDVLIHSSVYDDAYEDGTYNFYKMLPSIKKIVNSYDLAFYNQETILGGIKLGLSSYPAFNSPQEVGEAFVDAGFNLVSLANNHTLDRGKNAIINANRYWKTKKNVMTSGSYVSSDDRNQINIKEVNGIKYTMLAYTTTTNGIKPTNDYYVNVYDHTTVKEDIDKVRDKVDLLLVSMHWGEEYNTGVTNEQEQIAKYLSNLGVNIIIGHHPHVVEPIEYIGDTLVIYSLGNFISGQEGIDRQIGLMVSVEIEKIKDQLTISDPTAILTYTYYNNGTNKNNFKIYPFNELNNSLLPGYRNYYKTYMERVTSRTDRVIEAPI